MASSFSKAKSIFKYSLESALTDYVNEYGAKYINSKIQQTKTNDMAKKKQEEVIELQEIIQVDKGYATIFVDYDGVALDCDNLTPSEIEDVYYENDGSEKDDGSETDEVLPWNLYLIVAREVFMNDEDIREFEANDKYCRKYAIPKSEIDDYVRNLFPDDEGSINMGKIALCRHTINEYANAMGRGLEAKMSSRLSNPIHVPSIYRDKSLHETCDEMDKMRAELIRNKDRNFVYSTHLSSEFEWAEKKFKIFEHDEEYWQRINADKPKDKVRVL